MTTGRLIGIVGPSGVGKDSIIEGILARRPDIHPVIRTITRAPDLAGEDYVPVTQAEFETAAMKSAFCLHWQAHGLRYGIPVAVQRNVEAGAQQIVNLSRRVLPFAAEIFPSLVVLNVTASPEVLKTRLANRGRESKANIDARLARAAEPIDPSVHVITLCNEGPLGETVEKALRELDAQTMQPRETNAPQAAENKTPMKYT